MGRCLKCRHSVGSFAHLSGGRLSIATDSPNTLMCSSSFRLMRSVLLALLPLLVAPSAALAQKEIPKAPGFDQCPAGYVNTLGTTCVSPVYYEVAPTNGQACKAGWMNIGAGYCKKKKGPLGVL
ncbi:hypothetical [Parasynechococcus marenigrum WH 8102]|uniref:Uncharacterized protein n=2 Tax=Parasynechococcus TaxID=2881427 RepID=Q7U6G6_PARMW|nr:hypothetical [Parasynechococcus marenigrum WH 8102]